ncbi:MAG: hypothetical protein M8357_02810 [Desulfobulbaceae bacterium]|nr:hypothetical protein [Desulfobulbaceae bacterium]
MDFVDHRDDANMRRGAGYLGPYLAGHRNIRALSTHHLVLPLPVVNGAELFMIVMLRHPIERVQSVYNFERRQKRGSTPGAKKARKYNFKEYVAWRMRPDSGATIRNFQTIKCLHGHNKYVFKKNITDKAFTQAAATICSADMVGLVEHFDESMVFFEECIRSFFPEIDLSYRMQNVGQTKKKSRDERIQALRSELGEDLYRELLDKNYWDLKLYDLAEKELARRKEKVDDFSGKLEAFKKRCRVLQAE